MPTCPDKRAALLIAYTDPERAKFSPAVQRMNCIRKSEDNSPETACVQDIASTLSKLKRKCDTDSRAAVNVLRAAMNGDEVSKTKCVTKLAAKLGIDRRKLYNGKRVRTAVVRSEKSVFEYTKRKTRSDTTQEHIKKIAFDFWLRPEVSRTSNNKNDVKRVRIGKNKYTSHTCVILEKTQSEIYQEFKAAHPHLKMGQRTFEKCKPYYVRSASKKDMSTCCCRAHVETRSLFKACMSYLKHQGSGQIYETLSDVIGGTLCEPAANIRRHKRSCLNRECPDCGVDKINLLPEDLAFDENEVSWERYEYHNITQKDSSVLRKLVLVKKSTPPVEMFEYFKHLLICFPAHEFRAKWQATQLKVLTMDLPIGHCIAIHDFSENYKCTTKEEIQASYFQKVEVSIHVSVLHRHACLEVDGIQSTEETPKVVTEHFIVISPDSKHDHHFTHAVQQQVTDYLHSVTDEFHTLHEFTDGCSSQYKSCHCIGMNWHLLKTNQSVSRPFDFRPIDYMI